MLSTLVIVVVVVLLLVWLWRAPRRRSWVSNDGGWDPGYQPYAVSDNSCSPEARDDSCDSDTDSDSGGDCSSDGGGND
ncbi:hypothetical protein [Lysobacter sp. GCM10012299]|uniref:hypothetical protein n=1 Tax=Lysobacter sp. GCM10012299 TaxID=3317333 RepID=UPI00360EBBEF